MNTQEIKRAARDSKIGNAVFDALFKGMSLTDVAVKVRRMDKPEDMIPFLLRGLDLTQADIDNSPLKVDEDVVRLVLGITPTSDDNVEESVENALRPPALKVCAALVGRELLKNGKEGFFKSIENNANIQSEMVVFVWEVATIFIGQVICLWSWFHKSSAEVTTVAKDAYELVSSTRLQTNLTPDILEKVFERDIFLELPKPIHGFLDLCFIRDADYVFVYIGSRAKGKTFDSIKMPSFSRGIPVLNVKEQFGAITGEGISESVVNGSNFVTDVVGEWLNKTGMTEAAELSQDETKRFLEDFENCRSVKGFLFDAIVFVTKLRLMLLAEKPPVEETRTRIGKGGAGEGPKHRSEITVSVVSLTRDFREARASYESKGGHIDKTGKKVVEKFIAGFIRRQHYGQNNALVKTIFVSPFTNRFWVNAGVHVTKVVK